METLSDFYDLDKESVVREFCSTSGLLMDESWRFLGSKTEERVGDPTHWQDKDDPTEWPKGTAAGFIDEYRTVVACLIPAESESAWVELSVGADVAETTAQPKCPVSIRNMRTTDDHTVESYQFSGAGAVRDTDGRVLTEAKTLRIGMAGDSVTTPHKVVDGIAILAADVMPKVAVKARWNKPPPLEGQVLDADGKVLATCRG